MCENIISTTSFPVTSQDETISVLPLSKTPFPIAARFPVPGSNPSSFTVSALTRRFRKKHHREKVMTGCTVRRPWESMVARKQRGGNIEYQSRFGKKKARYI